MRTWTSTDGRTLEASLVQSDRSAVTLKLTSGREAVVPLERLSEADRAYIEKLSETGANLKPGLLPDETKINPSVEVEGGPRSFVTPHFLFESDRGVTKAFVSEAARVFEGTREAVAALPIGIVPKPAEGETRFRTLFLERDAFDREIARERGGESPVGPSAGTMVAGVYLPAKKEVLVPFSSLETTNSGSQVSLRRTSDVSTLIHEIVHQVMHDWLAMMPIWTAEGLAEYVSAVPYQNGRFEFKNAATGLKETLKEQYRIEEGQSVPVRHPADFLLGKDGAWTGRVDDYRSALILTYFFMHLDQPDKPGGALAAYLHLLGRSREDTEKFIADYNAAVKDFETKRLAFNQAVEAYNAAIKQYRAEADAYNQRINQYNAEAAKGVPEAERIKVGEAPAEPSVKQPMPLEVPAILKENAASAANGPIDILARIRDKARPALLRGRDPEEVATAMREAYAKMGIKLAIGRAK